MDLTAAGMLPFSRQKRLLKGVIFNDAGVGKDKRVSQDYLYWNISASLGPALRT